MSYIMGKTEGGHVWEKQNLVGKTSRRGIYDLLKCKGCGIEGRSYALGTIELKGSYSRKKIEQCPVAPVDHAPSRVKVTFCTAQGKQFQNLTPNSEHDVIEPPKGYANDSRGVWVMGVGEPVKLLKSEYVIVKS